MPGLVQVHQHDHPGFHRHPREGDKAHTHCDREIEIHPVHQPHATHQGERQCAHQYRHVGEAAKIHVQQHDDNGQCQGYHVGQPVFGALHIFVLAGPHDGVARRQLQLPGDPLASAFHVAAHVHPLDIHEGPAVDPGVLALDPRGAVHDRHVRHVSQGDTLPRGGDDRQQSQLLRGVAVGLGIADIDRVALQPLHRLGDIHSPHSGGHHLLHVGNIQAEASGALALDIHPDIAAAGNAFGVDRGGTLHL